MSKRVNISYLFSIILLLLTGCEQENSQTPSPNNGEEPVEILLSANVMQVSASIITRNDFVDETSFKDGTKQVGVFGLRTQDGSFNNQPYVENFAFTNTNGKLSGDGHIYFPPGYGKITAYLYGYYPYTDDTELYRQGNEVLIRVKGGLSGTTDAKWANAQTDPLHATASHTIERIEGATNDRSQITLALPFYHKMAQLQITVETQSGNEGKYQLQEIITTFSEHQHGYMNVRDGVIISADTGKTEICTEILPNGREFIGVSTIENPVAPQSKHSVLPGTNAIKRIQIKVNGKEYEAFNATTAGKGINLTAGYITAIKINFNPSTDVQATLDDTWNTKEEHTFDTTN